MNIKLLSMEIENFKGINNRKIPFSENMKISGQNGSGKTTVADAWFWLIGNVNYALNSNPAIFPNNAEEVTPTVTAEIDIDGKPVRISKMQKRKVSKPDAQGISKITLTNSYSINDVPKSEKDFKGYLADLGVDFEKFLQLSHPDVFLAGMSVKKMRDQMRNTLFEMAGTVSDLEISQMDSDTSDVAELRSNYTLGEIEAMQNATLRKIREDYGKSGEILRARIEGLESAKTTIETAELELLKNSLKAQIAEVRSRQSDLSAQMEEYQKLSDGILELQFELNDMRRKANEDVNRQRREIEDKISDKRFLISQTQRTIRDTKSEILALEDNIGRHTKIIENARIEYSEEKNREFDESSLICPYCGQQYSAEKREQLMAEFESHKAEMIEEITKRGNGAKKVIDNNKSVLEKMKAKLSEHQKSLEMLNGAIEELEKELSDMPEKGVDISVLPKAQEIQKQIAEKENAMESASQFDGVREQLRCVESDLQSQLVEIEKKIALSTRNLEIDEQISALRKKQAEYEQSKADCEKILYQISLVNRKKNEVLTDRINEHFRIVKWRLFTYQKNGNYMDDCTPLIDNKVFGTETNKGREILAKLDIVRGLQEFFGQHYPVVLDNSESLSEVTKNRIEADCQLVMLAVSEDKELVVA